MGGAGGSNGRGATHGRGRTSRGGGSGGKGPSHAKTPRYVAIEERSGRGDRRRRRLKGQTLSGQNVTALGNEAIRKGREVADACRGKESLEGQHVGAFVEDDGVAVVDEEGTGRRKIAQVHVSEGVVEKLIGVGGTGKS